MTPRMYWRQSQNVYAARLDCQDWDEVEQTAQWAGAATLSIDRYLDTAETAAIFIPQGNCDGAYACDGDWIVQLPDGTFAIYTDTAFTALYQPAVDG